MNYYGKMSKPKQTKADYSKGFIYELRCRDRRITDTYSGSSTNEVKRKQTHKTRCNNPKDPSYNFYVYQFIRAHGGWDNWEMVVIKLYPCNSKMELEMEEQRMIDELGATLNSQRAWCSEETRKEDDRERKKQYREEHKEEIVKYQKKYYEEHKEDIMKTKKKYTEEHKEEISEKNKIYYGKKQEKIKERVNKYRKTHQEEIRERKKKYRETHKEKISEKRKETYTCHCGVKLTKAKRKRHETTLYHQAWLAMPAPILLFID